VIAAHIGGLPVEESMAQLAPAGAVLLIGLQVTVARLVGRFRRRPDQPLSERR
jgi:hypothetical protein